MTDPLNKFLLKQPVGNDLSRKYPGGITTARLRVELGFHKPEWQSLRVQGILPQRSVKISGSKLARLDLGSFKTAADNTVWIPSHRVTEEIGVPETVFRSILGREPVGEIFGYPMWTRENIDYVTGTEEYKRARETASGRSERRRRNRLAKVEKLEEFERRAAIVVARVTADPLDRAVSETTVLHIGPTNSGKTFHALQELEERFRSGAPGRFVYAGPLRLLAAEVHDKLAASLGKQNVGIITGEETVRPDAPVICATAECAAGIPDIDTLVIDEAHWVLDPARGHVWSRLLVSTPAKHKHVIAGLDAKDILVEALEPDRIVERSRLSRLSEGPAGKKKAIIAFSRANVLEIAEKLGPSAIPLYGAMPIDTKKRQINLFNNDNRITTIVSTDVIGHGLNLPLDTVELSACVKWDGQVTRPLMDWELAQIVGRAGRADNPGTVIAERMPPETLKRAIAIANGDLRANDDLVRKLNVLPGLAMLGVKDDEARFIPHAVKRWQELAANYDKDSVYVAGDVTRVLENLGEILPRCGRATASEVWSLANGPFSYDSPALRAGARWLGDRADKALTEAYGKVAEHWPNLESLERAARGVNEFRALALVLGKGRDLTTAVPYDRMVGDERGIAKQASKLLDAARVDKSAGTR